jgi:hypothetical protein
VAVAEPPPTTEVGEKITLTIDAGFRVMLPCVVEGPRVAVRVSTVVEETAEDVTGNDFAVNPAGTVTDAG